MRVSIILPTYNEKDNIIPLTKQIVTAVRSASYTPEVIIVDDDSMDRTGQICKKYFEKNKNVRIFVRRERGLASAILYGLKKSRGTVVIAMDTDFSHDPNLIPLMLQKLQSFDIVIASRYARRGGGENKARYFMSKLYNIYLGYLLGVPLSDFLFGCFCTRKSYLLKHNLLTSKIFSGYGDYFIRLAFSIHSAHGKVVEIPAFYKDRVHGKSKSNLKKMFITYTYTSLQLKLKQLFA